MDSKNNNKKVRLLEVKNVPKPPAPKVEKTEAQIENEKLQKMIQEKLSLFEEGGEDSIAANKVVGSQTPVEDAQRAKLTKIYGMDADNKEKIALMVKLYHEEVIVNYKKNFEDVMYTSSRQSMDQILSEYYQQKAKRSEIIMEKYKMLSQEYQTQAKQFQVKHDEI